MSKTVWVQIDAYVSWAKIFEENRDTAEKARKQGVTHKGVLKGLEATEGKYTVDVSPATEADFDKVKAVLTDQVYGGAERYKDSEFGVGKSFNLQRKHLDKKTFKDRNTGEDKEYDFGGEPELVWWNDEHGKDTPWDKQTDGFLGNGTKVKLKFSVYQSEDKPTTGDTLRLEKIGVVDHVKFESAEGERF